jgi:hypothetical protein
MNWIKVNNLIIQQKGVIITQPIKKERLRLKAPLPDAARGHIKHWKTEEIKSEPQIIIKEESKKMAHTITNHVIDASVDDLYDKLKNYVSIITNQKYKQIN